MADKYPNVPCSECGALANEPCQTESGKDAAKPHAARQDLLDAQVGQFQAANRVDKN